MASREWVRRPGFTAVQGAVDEVVALGLAERGPEAAAPVPAARLLRSAPLHRTLLVPAPAGGERILKFHRGRPFLDLVRDLIAGRAHRAPARIECEVLEELRRAGFSVPRALAWGTRRGESFALLEPVPGVPLDDWLRGPDGRDARRRRRLLSDLARILARFHGERRFHRDLYACHVLVGPGGTLSLIDLARARRGRFVRRRWFVKDLAALEFSLPSPPVTRGERLRFLDDYLAARGLEARSRAWRRAIARRAARLRGRAASCAAP